MEQEIYDILKKIICECEINRLLNSHAEEFEYPINYNKITFNALITFNKNYFNKYKDCLLKNAAIYAIKINDEKYFNTFNQININYLIKNDIMFRALITKYAFYNINCKINKNINNDDKIVEKNKSLYSKLTITHELNTFTNLYRKTIIKFLKNFDCNELEFILDDIIFTNKYDNELINNTYINSKNINEFKLILLRIIISDTYLHLKSLEKDEEFDDYLESITNQYCDNKEIEEDESILNEIDIEVLNFIENNIKNNELIIPSRKDLRLYIYTKFIMYNIFLKEHIYDIENISDDKDAIKKLKKINPYYFLDYLNN